MSCVKRGMSVKRPCIRCMTNTKDTKDLRAERSRKVLERRLIVRLLKMLSKSQRK